MSFYELSMGKQKFSVAVAENVLALLNVLLQLEQQFLLFAYLNGKGTRDVSASFYSNFPERQFRITLEVS